MVVKPISLAAAILLAAPSALEAASDITRSVSACGGGTSSSAGHVARFTLGQSVVASVSSANHLIWSGFWEPALPTVDLPWDEPPLPSEFALGQGRPNPFSGTTIIAFDVPQNGGASGRIRLCVYDMAGRLVRTLHDGPAEPGRFLVQWRGDDDQGRALATGIYACVLETPHGRFTRRAVLLR